MLKVAFCFVFLAVLAEAKPSSAWRRTPLDDYIDKEEPDYGWELIGEYPDFEEGVDGYVLNVTSQKWMTENETNQPIWYHYVIVVVPHDLQYQDTAFIMVDNGNMDDRVPEPEFDGRFESTAEYARGTGAVAVDIKMIPNQRLWCAGDPPDHSRREDDLIAWTWRRFVDDPSDPEILLQLPMTKGAVKSMDAVVEFMSDMDPDIMLDQFMVSGGSKRGWTAYLVAAVDERVFAIAPSVLSCLNFQQVMMHQYEAYGGWSITNRDYYNEGLMADINHPNVDLMMEIIDPYAYAYRLDMPKLIISAAGDEHFMPDDTWYFWDDLPGQNYFWMLEDSGHNIGGSKHSDRIIPNRVEFFNAVRNDLALPNMSWDRAEIDNYGYVTLYTDVVPKELSVTFAYTLSEERRDFREHIGPDPDNPVPQPIEWYEIPVEQIDDGIYRASFGTPLEGWLVFFIKATYEGPRGQDLYYTSEVNILPDILPFDPCTTPEECDGPLV